MPLRKIADAIRQSLWFVPGTWVIACGAAAFAMVALDRAAGDVAPSVPLVFSGGPEGARGMLSAIASSMITVVGVVFSITIVGLQLASSQYSPRVLRNFMRDRPSQITLGSFIGVFVYSLLVLRTVRAESDEREEFVPVLAVTGAIVLTVVAVAMLVYFIHHIATRMQVSSIAAAVARETLDEVARQAAASRERDVPRRGGDIPDGPGANVPASKSGYLQYVEHDDLLELAEREDVVVRVAAAPGEWVQRHAPLFEVWGGNRQDGLDDELRGLVSLGDQRVVFQDIEFGVQQLVDIAVKALSPGVNDPTTARNALHRIGEVVVAAGRANLTPVDHHDGSGRLRLRAPRAEFEQLMRTAFEEIHHFGGDIPTIARSLSEALDTIESVVDPQHLPAVSAWRHRPRPRSSPTTESAS
ncbi:MAG: DUF2254 domain-containing protein [Chloroflexota bacterium]